MSEPGSPRRALPIAVAAVAGLLVVLAAIVLPVVLQGDEESSAGPSAADGSSVAFSSCAGGTADPSVAV